MDRSTQLLAKYIKDKGVSVATISRETGIPYGSLHFSVARERSLKADEFLAICGFLEIDPRRFLATPICPPAQESRPS